MEIEFERPFSLRMDVIETDDHVPSMRVETKIVVAQYQHTLSYQGSFWIECAELSRFANALTDTTQGATLKDISECFCLSVSEADGNRILSCVFERTEIDGKKKAGFALSCVVDDDVMEEVRRSFREFPAWW